MAIKIQAWPKEASVQSDITWWILFSLTEENMGLLLGGKKHSYFKDHRLQIHQDVTLNWFEECPRADSPKQPQKTDPYKPLEHTQSLRI